MNRIFYLSTSVEYQQGENHYLYAPSMQACLKWATAQGIEVRSIFEVPEYRELQEGDIIIDAEGNTIECQKSMDE